VVLHERAHDIIRIELGVRTVVPFDRQRCQPFFCSAHIHSLKHFDDRETKEVEWKSDPLVSA